MHSQSIEPARSSSADPLQSASRPYSATGVETPGAARAGCGMTVLMGAPVATGARPLQPVLVTPEGLQEVVHPRDVLRLRGRAREAHRRAHLLDVCAAG